ncbi:hypothetical protein C7M61_003035 [Candidozyma pseudohaemuli]|uniref:Uncharacterized protein n=1 Tax=Candidozyma pseudohaemuli TaxID=418784 RepID=A0A2P7YPB9_9ASCO|nr:hypothetical protein C7M61_003035 [[Candida] pseudohaemulonii]PSK37790.1 hypothetical protein C7M61_003035 [[Candida] pseudohaemulonii]
MSPKLKLFLRLVRSPSHILFLVSNLAILVHLQFVSTTRSAKIVHLKEKDNFDKLRAQIIELEELEEEERLIRKEIEALKNRASQKERAFDDSLSESKVSNSGSTYQRTNSEILNKNLALDFRLKRLSITSNFMTKEGMKTLFTAKNSPRWSFMDRNFVSTQATDDNQFCYAGERNAFQAFLRYLIGDVILESLTSLEIEISESFKSDLFHSLIYETTTAKYLNHERSDTTKFIASSQESLGTRTKGHQDLMKDIRAAFESYLSNGTEIAKCELLLDLCRTLIPTIEPKVIDEALNALYQHFGILGLHNYQALLLETFPTHQFHNGFRATYFKEKPIIDTNESVFADSNGENESASTRFSVKEPRISSSEFKHLRSKLTLLLFREAYDEAENVLNTLLRIANDDGLSLSGRLNEYESDTRHDMRNIFEGDSLNATLRALDRDSNFESKFSWLRPHLTAVAEDRHIGEKVEREEKKDEPVTGYLSRNNVGKKNPVLKLLPESSFMAMRVQT